MSRSSQESEPPGIPVRFTSYQRQYSYQLLVSPSGEMVTTDVRVTCGSNIHPHPAPSGLTANVEYHGGANGTVTLAWAAAGNGYGCQAAVACQNVPGCQQGQHAGVCYHVVRGAAGTLSNCHVPKTILGTTSALTFQDTDAGVGDTYHYRVIAEDTEGQSDPSNEVTACIECQLTSAPEVRREAGVRLSVVRAAATGVELMIETGEPELVRVEVYNVQGRRVGVPLDDVKVDGRYPYRWEGRGSGGEALGSGVYFVRLRTATGLERRAKVVLLR